MADFSSSLIRPVRLSESNIAELVSELYGLHVKLVKELDSYNDRNYLLADLPNLSPPCDQNPQNYVLKVLNSVDSKEPRKISLQNDVIIFAKKAGYPAPAPLINLEGTYHKLMSFENKTRGITETSLVRLFEYYPGTTLEQVPLTKSLCYQVGHYAGWLDQIYQDYHEYDESICKVMVCNWNLSQLPALWPHLDVIEDSMRQLLVKDILSNFEEEVLKHESSFSQGFIHSDINDCNLVVSQTSVPVCDIKVGNDYKNGQPITQSNDEKEAHGHNNNIVGVIDFGDLSFSCHLYEIAIAIAYIVINNNSIVSPLEAAGCLLSGYLKHINLSDFELERLKICVCARMAQSIVMTLITLKANPDNIYSSFHSSKMWGPMENMWLMSNLNFLQELRKQF